jgi:hypothetical protein
MVTGTGYSKASQSSERKTKSWKRQAMRKSAIEGGRGATIGLMIILEDLSSTWETCPKDIWSLSSHPTGSAM